MIDRPYDPERDCYESYYAAVAELRRRFIAGESVSAMAKRSDTWMPLYIGDYLADTMHLTHAQHGIYLLLIMAYWRTGRPLPDDADHLAAASKCSAVEWRKHRPVIAKFFHIEGGTWSHKRIDAELAAAAKHTQERSKAGAEGAAKRWQTHGKTHGKAIANRMANEWQIDGPSPSQSEGEGGDVVSPRNPTTPNFKNLTSLTEPLTARANPDITAESEEGKALKFDSQLVPIGRSAPSAPNGALAAAAEKRELLRQKLFRFCQATFAEPQLTITVAGLCGGDPKHNERWWLNRVDKLMRAEHWDDTRPSRRDTAAALGYDPGPNPDADDYAFRQAAAAVK